MNTNFWIQTWIHTHRLQRPLLYWSLSQKKQERAVLSQKEEESAVCCYAGLLFSWCFTSTETIRPIWDREPKMAALTFTWLLSSEYRPCLKNWLKSSWSSCLHVGGSPLNLKHSAYCWWECSGRVCSDHTVFQLVPVSNSSYKQWAPLLLHLAACNLEVRGVSDCVIRHILSIYI